MASQKADLTTVLLLGDVPVLFPCFEKGVILSAEDDCVHITAIDFFKAF